MAVKYNKSCYIEKNKSAGYGTIPDPPAQCKSHEKKWNRYDKTIEPHHQVKGKDKGKDKVCKRQRFFVKGMQKQRHTDSHENNIDGNKQFFHNKRRKKNALADMKKD